MTTATGRIVFIDTETTSLRPDRRIWEIALIVHEPDREPREWHRYVAAVDLDLANADPLSLRIGQYYERHPEKLPIDGEPYTLQGQGTVMRERDIMLEVEQMTRDAILVGAVPSFDAEALATRMRAHGILPLWHYHLQDVETLTIGFLLGRGENPGRPPYNSEDLSRRIGVEPPSKEERHTALGDARWAKAIWDRIHLRVV